MDSPAVWCPHWSDTAFARPVKLARGWISGSPAIAGWRALPGYTLQGRPPPGPGQRGAASDVLTCLPARASQGRAAARTIADLAVKPRVIHGVRRARLARGQGDTVPGAITVMTPDVACGTNGSQLRQVSNPFLPWPRPQDGEGAGND